MDIHVGGNMTAGRDLKIFDRSTMKALEEARLSPAERDQVAALLAKLDEAVAGKDPGLVKTVMAAIGKVSGSMAASLAAKFALAALGLDA